MVQYNTVKGISFLLLIMLVVFFNGCKAPVVIQSKWLDNDIVIDGKDTDWTHYPFFSDEKTGSAIGLYNDDQNLFICFRTSDKDLQRRILSQGAFIWFNKTGKKDKELAINYPLEKRDGRAWGAPPDMGAGMPAPPPGMPPDRSDQTSIRPNDSNMPVNIELPKGSSPDDELRILSSEKDSGYKCNIEKAARIGIEIGYTINEMGMFIYELKMPLVEKKNIAFFVTPSALNQMGIGIMTAEMKRGGHSHEMGEGEMDRGGMGRDGDGDMPGGGDRGGRGPMPEGGMGGGMGGGPGPGGMEKSGKSFEIWFNVTLAPKPMKE
jgi:hypothetical protein